MLLQVVYPSQESPGSLSEHHYPLIIITFRKWINRSIIYYLLLTVCTFHSPRVPYRIGSRWNG